MLKWILSSFAVQTTLLRCWKDSSALGENVCEPHIQEGLVSMPL